MASEERENRRRGQCQMGPSGSASTAQPGCQSKPSPWARACHCRPALASLFTCTAITNSVSCCRKVRRMETHLCLQLPHTCLQHLHIRLSHAGGARQPRRRRRHLFLVVSCGGRQRTAVQISTSTNPCASRLQCSINIQWAAANASRSTGTKLTAARELVRRRARAAARQPAPHALPLAQQRGAVAAPRGRLQRGALPLLLPFQQLRQVGHQRALASASCTGRARPER
jgi:hypothetical protein